MSAEDEEQPRRGRQRAPQNRARAYTFTWNQNNRDGDEFVGVPVLRDFGEHARYLVYGHEVGDAGNFHLQGYVAFDQQVAFSTVSGAIPGAHIERAKGNATQNRAYCIKDQDFVEEGVFPQQGRRNDLWDLKEIAKSRKGIRLRDAIEEFPAIVAKYPRFVDTLQRVYGMDRREPPIVFYFWGPTGRGKSRTAYVLARMLGRVFRVPQAKGSGLYYDAYDGEEVLLFDEFYGNRMKWASLLDVTDRYPNMLACHGGAGRANVAKYIFFCSNAPPDKLYPKIKVDPFLRRIHWLQYFGIPRATHHEFRAPRETRANFFVSPFSGVTKFLLRAIAPVEDATARETRRLQELRDEATYVDSEGKVRIRGG